MSFRLAGQQSAEKISPRSAYRRAPGPHKTTDGDFASQTKLGIATEAADSRHAPRYSYGFGSINIFPKLAINDPGDAYEQEADRVADRVMSTAPPESSPARTNAVRGENLQRKCASCEEEEEQKVLHRKESGAAGKAAPPIVHQVLGSPGRPLEPSVRAFMESRFEHDFGAVRVHTDEKAASSARAINALAYTAGEDIVFDTGQHRPETWSGKHLLAHELAHVAQQHTVSPGAAGTVRRAPGPADEKKRLEEHERTHAELAKKDSLRQHEEQQRHVASLLSEALKTPPDPTKGPLDADNLFHNTAEMLDRGKMQLTVLSPTHYSDPLNPVYFDERVKHPNIGGDYPLDRAHRDSGVIDPPSPGTKGQTLSTKSERMSLSTLPPKVEGDEPAKEPVAAKPKKPPVVEWAPAEIRLFTSSVPISKGEFKNVFVHEGQHVADWSYLKDFKSTDWHSVLEHYKTEFRAFWLQPPIPRENPDDIVRDTPFPDPDPIKASEKQTDVTLGSAKGCDDCGGTVPASTGGKAAPSSRATKMKNKRQEAIFWHLVRLYPQDQFDCRYVCNEPFRNEVNDYDGPAGTNVVNSARVMDVTIELQKVTPSATRDEVGKTQLLAAIGALDAIDWAFLRDKKLSAPFWASVSDFAPAPLQAAFKALAGKKSPPSSADVSKSLQAAVAKLKP